MGTGELSIVRVMGEYASSCGYCHSKSDTSVAFGMTAERLTVQAKVQAYQELIDCGWRRSGTWLYLPVHGKTCCPCYTHRLDVTKFAPSKAQQKVMRKFQAYLQGADLQKPPSPETEPGVHGDHPQQTPGDQDLQAPAPSQQSEQSSRLQEIAEGLGAAIQACKTGGSLPSDLEVPELRVKTPASQHLRDAGVSFTSPVAFALSAAACKAVGSAQPRPPQEIAELLAAQLRADFGDVQAAKGHLNFLQQATVAAPACRTGKAGAPAGSSSSEGSTAAVSPRQLVRTADACVEADGAPDRQADVSGSCRSDGAEAQAEKDAERVASGSQATTSLMVQQQQGRGTKRTADGMLAACRVERELEVVMVRSSPALRELEYPLYRKYQMRQHGDPPSKVTAKSFRRFLIDSPLIPVAAEDCPEGGTPPCGFGSFHQQYWIDGVLVAVGVVDVLPACLSSKYFFWDPDLAPLALGKVSAMKEIQWVAAASLHCPSLKHYYMGYYIHTCPKMRYKVDFKPADLLCPKSLEWVPFHRIQAALDADPRTILSEVPAAAQGLVDESSTAEHSRRIDAETPPGNVMALKVVLPELGQHTAIPLGHLIEHGIFQQSFVEHTMRPVLAELVAYLGPAAEQFAIAL